MPSPSWERGEWHPDRIDRTISRCDDFHGHSLAVLRCADAYSCVVDGIIVGSAHYRTKAEELCERLVLHRIG